MGLTFYAADSREEIGLNTPYADLPTEVTEFLYKRRAQCPEQAAFFWELDPYGDAEFCGGQITELARRCAELLARPWEPAWRENEEAETFTAFLRELCALCLAVAQRGGAVILLGD